MRHTVTRNRPSPMARRPRHTVTRYRFTYHIRLTIYSSTANRPPTPMPTPLRQFFLLCARSPFDSRRQQTLNELATLAPHLPDRETLLESIRVERMIPLVRLWLRDLRRELPDAVAVWPVSFWHQLESLYRHAVAYNLHVIDGWTQTQAQLAAAGICAIPIKGPALSMLAYDDAALRQVEDMDAIIAAGQLPEAARILTIAGYRQVGGPSNPALHRAYAASSQDWLFEDAHNRLLDIKPVPLSHRIARATDIDKIKQRLVPLAMDAEGRTVWQAPDRIAMTLLACMHGTEEGWPCLRNVADVAGLICRLTPDEWPELIQTARLWRQRTTLVFALALCEKLNLLPSEFARYSSVPRSSGIRKLLNRTELRLLSEERMPVSPASAAWCVLLLRDSWPEKVRCLWIQITSASRRDWETRPPGYPHWLLPFRRLRRHLKEH